jgi:integrase
MATIGHDSGGRKRILFVAGDGKRKTIRLGKMSTKQATSFNVYVEELCAAARGAKVIDNATADWLSDLDDVMHARIAAVGLVKPRESSTAVTLAAFIDLYIVGRTDIKTNTLIGLKQARRNLVEFFGETKPLASISEGDAEDYWRWLIAKLAINTARRLCGRAKQFFRFAVRKRIIRDNPFAEIESNVRSNPDRKFFITREMAEKVDKACPDAEWRLIFALSRFGGLRCPSEHLALKWADVDWEKNRVCVPSPKTEHIEGRATRLIPLFPELRKPLLEVFGQAEEGAVYVISRYRQPNSNLRTQFERILKRAALDPWPKIFHNLRASRQTELAEKLPAHVVCAWLGNTEEVAKAHYLQVTDAHFAQAIEGAAQNQAQQTAESSRTVQKPASAESKNRPESPNDSATCDSVQNEKWPLSESNRYACKGGGF